MSTPKTAKILNPQIKISKTGRPYIDVADLVKTMLEGPQKEASDSTTAVSVKRNGGIFSNNTKSDTRKAKT